MKHPSDTTLALYAGRDLGFWSRWKTERHLRECDRCRAEVDVYGELREGVADLGDIPEIAWNRLAAEMKANIRVGLAAGECVAAPAPRHRLTGWRAIAAYGCAAALILASVFIEHPAPPAAHFDGVVLEATGNGIELKEGGQAMTLMHGRARDVTYSAGAQGSMRARYVDSDTGYVTINNVYVQ